MPVDQLAWKPSLQAFLFNTGAAVLHCGKPGNFVLIMRFIVLKLRNGRVAGSDMWIELHTFHVPPY